MRYPRQNIFAAAKTACLGGALSLLYTETASAHVKWFCAYDVAGQPRGLENVLCPDFEALVGVSVLTLMAGCLTEASNLGTALQRACAGVLEPIRIRSELLMRMVVAFFFVALWTTGGIILTPELKTSSALIPWLQLAIAFGMLGRRSLVFSAAGMVGLFAVAVHDYGSFHLMDYPIFLGLAAYFALLGLDRRPFGLKPLAVVRWAAAVTLMWASIEKWAYPEWTFPLFVSHPQMTMGLDREFFMRAAGMVEFALSFALIWTPLCRRFSALILAGMFISAVLEFGKIDAIGHAPIIVAMLAIAADDTVPAPGRHAVLWVPAGFAGALGIFMTFYYVLHSVLFGTSLV